MIDLNSEIIKFKLKKLPTDPGVYIMKNKFSQIIYVGKAKNLKNRVSQYFTNTEKSLKVKKMVQHIYDIDYIVTRNAVEALILENNLIKENNPQYNILLKDDKTYSYIRIDLNEKYPKIEKSRGIQMDKARYFGPFMQNININDVLKIIQKIMKIRTCKLNLQNEKKYFRPCLYYQTNHCLAPCIRNCTEEYNMNIKKTLEFLSGDTTYVRNFLISEIEQYSSKLDYENALKNKKMLDILDRMDINQVIDLEEGADLDVIAIGEKDNLRAISILFIRSGHMLGKDIVIVDDCNPNLQEAFLSFLTMFYSSNRSIPTNILLNMQIENPKEFLAYMKEKLNIVPKLSYPLKGKKHELIKLAEINVQEFSNKQYLIETNKYNKTIGALDILEKELGLKIYPKRIECFDVSHISGINKVASMTVLINGLLDKKSYRRFKIKTVEGNNDFASMQEIVERRLKAYQNNEIGFQEKPNLIVIDGGSGQLSYAKKILEQLGINDIELISLAERDELICTTSNSEYIKLSKNNPALQLLITLRDEAHRFAINYHRRLRNNTLFNNSLNNIPGIGKKKIESLLNVFNTIENIKKATPEELVNVKYITKNDAKNIYEYFLNN